MELSDSEDILKHRLIHTGGPFLFRKEHAARLFLCQWLCAKSEEEYRDLDSKEKMKYQHYFDGRCSHVSVKKKYRTSLEALECLAENLHEGKYVSARLEWELKRVEIK